MSTKAEKLRAHEQRENAARKRALVPTKSAKPLARAKGAGPVKAVPRRPVKRRAVTPLQARIG